VPNYYESRLALDETSRPMIDSDSEEVTEGEEVERKEKLKSKSASRLRSAMTAPSRWNWEQRARGARPAAERTCAGWS
jgi:hypothetical protein